jgi:hypothetical protein
MPEWVKYWDFRWDITHGLVLINALLVPWLRLVASPQVGPATIFHPPKKFRNSLALCPHISLKARKDALGSMAYAVQQGGCRPSTRLAEDLFDLVRAYLQVA